MKDRVDVAYLRKVKQSLARLTPEERTAVMMARVGYSYSEIAARMNITVELLRAHLRRGFLTLKKSVTEPEQE